MPGSLQRFQFIVILDARQVEAIDLFILAEQRFV
jgi:hypothetical protein